MLGTLTSTTDGRWQLRYTRHLAHAPERVWRALTEDDELAAWFPSTIEGERRAGAPLRFRFDKDGDEAEHGEMLTFDPPRLLELRWGTDELRFELTPVDGGTELVLVDTFDEQGKAARDGAGWHECLDLLPAVLAGDPPPFGWGERWSAVHPDYVTAFGPDGSSIGPPEGHDPAYVDSTRPA
jgi:uncharacterized protein YndB with AHSA1/START domain